MHGLKLGHGFISERQGWLRTAVVLGLVLSTQAAVAKECHQETPLPADVRLIAPAPEVPEAVRRFAGVWNGAWENTDGFCHTLVVEEVFANGFARVIVSSGTSVVLSTPLPGFLHARHQFLLWQVRLGPRRSAAL